MFDVLVIGGGAAGFYGAIHIAEAAPGMKIGILERGREVLSKVKISGGGRCNVANAEFDPEALAGNFPRGQKELLGPFHRYCSGDTMEFFNRREVPLKIEDDGRIFPESDSSQTIINCFMDAIRELGVQLYCNHPVLDLQYHTKDDYWEVITNNTSFKAGKLLLATGSSHKIWHLLERLGHTLVPPVPSLFTFNIKDERLEGMQGVSSRVRIGLLEKKPSSSRAGILLRGATRPKTKMEEEGPVLITHWGLSGPAVLRLSAWGARLLNEYDYRFRIHVNWIPDYHPGALMTLLTQIKEIEAKKTIFRTHALELPRRLWTKLVLASGISKTLKWADLSKQQLQDLTGQLTACEFEVVGKSTFKEEFVTAGGIDLREIDFRTFESKRLPGLYFAGEIINVDAITGGFNFQNAWTGAYIAAKGITGKT
jgi:hypothetical protein